jgi:predicted GNAT family acetyltransferase
VNVRHDEVQRAFLVDVEGGTGELTYSEKNGVLDLNHTFVPEASEGKGVGGTLARAALDYARRTGRKITPTCPFVDAFVRKHHDEYGDLLA